MGLSEWIRGWPSKGIIANLYIRSSYRTGRKTYNGKGRQLFIADEDMLQVTVNKRCLLYHLGPL
jgi:hypothetical protein